MSKISKIFNPQSKILFHLDTVLDYFKGKKTDPITLEIDGASRFNKISQDSINLCPRIGCSR